MAATDDRPDGITDERAGAGPLAERPRRNLVLLSDGTGNSAAKLNKTNVWRLYQALDLGRDEQIAFYDDGVGTSGIRPLRLLGGAVGWGLSRNVRDLYEFLCRHHREGDQLYLFGFSRGAFTVRTLAGLIARCGVLDCSKAVPGRGGRSLQLNTREGLKAGVKLAYRSYRRGYKAPVARLYRWLRDLILRPVPPPDEFRHQYSFDSVGIRFIGVWDTVDAVGLPVDELSTMIDRIFYPHRFPDQDLSPRVERACHAIAIDDERHTFHPVLWNEHGTADSGRISQVWFAGMHSNVGGGYPDDDLACVSLRWMIGETQFDPSRGDGLRFDQNAVRAIRQRAQALGKMYNSRRGFGIYYRYNPRHVATLCDDRQAGVLVAEPKIHQAVLERLAENTTGYAPAGLPQNHRVVDQQGGVSDLNPTDYEGADQRQRRAALLERAQHHIFWRRAVFYVFVLTTLALLLMPYVWPPIPGAQPVGWLEAPLWSVLRRLPPLLPGFVGSWAHHWSAAWTQAAPVFVGLAIFYGWLLWHSRVIDANIHRLSEVAWWHIKRCPEPQPPIPAVGFFERMARRLRRAERLQQLRRVIIRWVGPVLTLAAVACIVVGAIYRFAVHLPAVGSGICSEWLEAEYGQVPANDRGVTVFFDTSVPCVDTGLLLDAGRKYRVEVVARGWQDDGYEADVRGLRGFSRLLDPAFVLGLPARRHLSLPWFVLTGEIGRDSGDLLPINRTRIVFEPLRSGRLHLYVNDAIDGFGIDPYRYYRGNQGSTAVTVRPDE